MIGHAAFAHPEFNLAASELRKLGHEVFNPADKDLEIGFNPVGLQGTMQELAEAGFNRRRALGSDMDWIALNSEGMVCLPTWRQSSGARAEVAFHHALGLPVWSLQDFINQGSTAPQILPAVPATDPATPRAKLLDEAKGLITGDRNNTYGPPDQDFRRSADALNAYGYKGPGGRDLLPHDIAIMVMSVKLSRLVWSFDHSDSWLDIAGYSACGYECTITEKEI